MSRIEGHTPVFTKNASETSICFHHARRWFPRWLLLGALVLAGSPAGAGVIVIGQGSSLATGAGQVDLRCGDAEIGGSLSGSLKGARDITLAPGAELSGALLSLSGSWINNGGRSINASVDWPDGCGVVESRMLGSSDLLALTISSQSGREIRFDGAGEQLIADSLSLSGTPDALLRLRSTGQGQFARLSLDSGGSQMIHAVDVAYIDSNAGQSIAPGNPAGYDSVRSGPVRNWFVLPPIPVSTLGLLSTLLLGLLMLLLGLFFPRRVL